MSETPGVSGTEREALVRQLREAAERDVRAAPDMAGLQQAGARRRRARLVTSALGVAAVLCAGAVSAVAAASTTSATVRVMPAGPSRPVHALLQPTATPHRSKPPRPARTTPAPAATASSPTPTPPTSTATPAPPTIRLVAGPYGFLVPSGWGERPLAGAGGPARFARFTDPSSAANLRYEVSGGETSVVYYRDHTPNLAGALTQVRCTVAASSTLSPDLEAAYTCRPLSPGMDTWGVVVVEPFPTGWQDLQVTLPAADRTFATAILDSFADLFHSHPEQS